MIARDPSRVFTNSSALPGAFQQRDDEDSYVEADNSFGVRVSP